MRILILFFLCLFSSGGYAFTVVKEAVTVDRPQEIVLDEVGDFCNITWHPLIVDTVCSDDGLVRNVVLFTGQGVVEVLTYQGNKKYSYEMTKQCSSFVNNVCEEVAFGTVLPVQEGYTANIKVVPAGEDSSKVMWQSKFYPTTLDAEVTLRTIFRAGLDSL